VTVITLRTNQIRLQIQIVELLYLLSPSSGLQTMSHTVREIYESRPQGNVAALKRFELIKLSSLLSALRGRFSSKPGTIPRGQSEWIDKLYVALWDRIVCAIGDAAVNGEANNNWPNYFNDLRDLTSRVVGKSTTIGLSESEKVQLTRRLVESIHQLEHEFCRLLELADK
jgi:hypothetical protein